MNQTFCNLCECRTENLTRRGTFFLCDPCTTRWDYEQAKDIATDPRATSAERARARRRARVLGRQLARLRKEQVA